MGGAAAPSSFDRAPRASARRGSNRRDGNRSGETPRFQLRGEESVAGWRHPARRKL